MRSIENNEQYGRCITRCASRVELTFHWVALFSRERIEPQVDYAFYSMAIIENICRTIVQQVFQNLWNFFNIHWSS